MPGSMAGCLSNVPSDIRQSMRKYYEDTMKRYMSDLQAGAAGAKDPPTPVNNPQPETVHPAKSNQQNALDLTSGGSLPKPLEGAPALDLSKPDQEAGETVQWDSRSVGDSVDQSEGNQDTRQVQLTAKQSTNSTVDRGFLNVSAKASIIFLIRFREIA